MPKNNKIEIFNLQARVYWTRIEKKVVKINEVKNCQGQLRSKMLYTYSSKEVKKLDEIEQLNKYSKVFIVDHLDIRVEI